MRPRSVLKAFVLSGIAVAAFAAAAGMCKGLFPIETTMTLCARRKRVRKKALLIGINYDSKNPREQQQPLSLAQTDVKAMAQLLKEQYEYEDIRVMTDEEGAGIMKPTRQNIERELKNFIVDPQPGDHYYFHYSGHADQLPCLDGTEDDDLNEYIIPADCENEDGYIPDDMLREYLVEPLPAGCNLVAVIDTCHSATMLDLPHFRCNGTYYPWVSRGQPANDLLWPLVASPKSAVSSRRASNDLLWLASPEAKKVIRRSSRGSTDVGSGCMLRQSSTSVALSQNGRVAVQSRSMSLKEKVIVEEDVSMDDVPQASEAPMTDLPMRTTSPEPLELSGHEQSPRTVSISSSSTVAPPAASRPIGLRPKRGVTLRVQIDLKEQDKCEFLTSPDAFRCNSPAVLCTGFNCRPCSPTERPHVVCLSACKDWQASYEGPRGESMTMVLIGVLKLDPQPQLKSLLERIGHRLHTSALNRHAEFQRFNEWVDRHPKRQARRMDTACFMDPQLSSLKPLDTAAEKLII